MVLREGVRDRGDASRWMATFDGFYLTRGHYLNNLSATLHGFTSGKIAYFTHQTKRGKGSNWRGTSAGEETDMLDELLGKSKQDVFFNSGVGDRQRLVSKCHILPLLS